MADGEVVVGVGMPFSSSNLVELFGAIGFDYVTLDAEHEPHDEASLAEGIRAADAFGITPIVRVPNDSHMILRLLNAGAQGIHVPGISTVEQARSVVKAARFHPRGERTFYATGRSGWYGIGLSEQAFVEATDREVMVILQIEDINGMERLDEILAVEGVNAIQFGPKDLRQSMGFPTYDVVWEQIEIGLEKVRAAGLWPSMVGWFGSDLNADKLARYRELGVRMITGQAYEFVTHGAERFRQLALECSRGRALDSKS